MEKKSQKLFKEIVKNNKDGAKKILSDILKDKVRNRVRNIN
jgi:hypothetical protein